MKNNFKVLIAEDTGTARLNNDGLLEKKGFRPFFCEKNGDSVIKGIEKTEPDAVIMDVFMSGLDAIGVMRSVSSRKDLKIPVFVVISGFNNSELEKEAMSAGAAYYVIKPYHKEYLLDRISEFLNSRMEDVPHTGGKILNFDDEMEMTVTSILHQIGVPAHIKGYHYLRTSIIMSVKRPDIINAVTKQLYPSVAVQYSTTPSRVERAIRHAIEVAWDRGDVDVLDSYFGYTIHNSRGKPTNSEFIAMIADRMRLKNKLAA